MAFEIIWTKQAENGYSKIVDYLIENWSEKEVSRFINETERFFEILSEHPHILQKTNKFKNLHRGPINRLTILTYRVKPADKQIELINIRGSRQRPLK